MYVSGNESCNRMAVVLPVFGGVALRDRGQCGRSDEHVGDEDDDADWNQSQHGVEVEHILEFVPLPSVNTRVRLC